MRRQLNNLGEKVMTITKNTIEIFGWLSDRQIAKGQTALWTGRGIDETCEIHDGYYFEDSELEHEIAEAQKYADDVIAQNGWPITVKVSAVAHKFETDEQ